MSTAQVAACDTASGADAAEDGTPAPASPPDASPAFRPAPRAARFGRASLDSAPQPAEFVRPIRAQAIAAPAPAPPPWLAALGQWLGNTVLAHDLAEAIGTPRWWRGLATLAVLVLAAWGLVPPFGTNRAAPPARISTALDQALRAQALRPLLFGSPDRAAPSASDLILPLAGVPERPTLALTATLGPNDSLPALLQRAGVPAPDAARATGLIAAEVPLANIAPGTRVAITLGRRADPAAPRPLEALNLRAGFDLDLDLRRSGAGLSLQRHAVSVDATPLRIRGIVGTSLYRSARAAGAPPAAIQDYLRALDQQGLLEGLDPADEFDFVLGWKRSASGQTEEGDLLFAGLDRAGEPRARLVRWGQNGDFVDALGSAAPAAANPQAEAFAMGAPVAGHITSGFGMRRHPILGYLRMHSGIDYAAGAGSPIYAVSDGVVSFAGWHGGHGNYVRLDHGGGLATGYGHMSRIAVGPGTRVSRGQVIGAVGSTGLSTGPHLHYELLRDGHTINPDAIRFMLRRPAPLPQGPTSDLPAVRARMAQLLAVEPGAALGPVR